MTSTTDSERMERIESIETIDVIADDLIEVLASVALESTENEVFVIDIADTHSFARPENASDVDLGVSDVVIHVRDMFGRDGSLLERLERSYEIGEGEFVILDAEINLA